MGSSANYGNNGAFQVPFHPKEGTAIILNVIASNGAGWEHVSVSLPHRCPVWEEMARVKELFWDDDDCVVQYHPPKRDYVNHHPFCLHLWRQVGKEYARPPGWLIGPRGPNE